MGKDAKFILLSFLVWKLIMVAAVLLSFLVVPFNQESLRFTFVSSMGKTNSLVNTVLFAGANFDGEHYLNIASRGYLSEGRFMPIFPVSIYIASLGGIKELVYPVAVLVVNIVFLAALFFLYALVKAEFGVRVGKMSIYSLLAFPTSFFWGSVYSEGMFLLLSLGVFILLKNNRILLAACVGVLLCLTRAIGVAILPIIAMDIFKSKVYGVFSNLARFFIVVVLVLSPLFAYGVYNQYKWGDSLYFIKAHGQLNNSRSVDGVVNPLKTIYRYTKIFLDVPVNTHQGFVAVVELVVFIFVIGILLWGYKRIGWKYSLYCGLLILIPVLTGTFSGLPRYAIVAFPLYILVALACKSVIFRYVYYCVSGLLLIFLTMMFSRGYFVA